MTDIIPVPLQLQGVAPFYTKADQPSLIVRGAQRCFVHVVNSGAVQFKLSITPINPVEGVPLRTLTVTVPAGASQFFGPLPALVLDNNGDLPITVTGTDLPSVGMAALFLPQRSQ